MPDQKVYSELTSSSLKKLMGIVIPLLPQHSFKTPLGILDIGSGFGLALCSLAKIYFPYPCFLVGLETSEERVQMSRILMPENVTRNVTEYKCEVVDLSKMENLPQVHISYSFDKTFPQDLMKHIEELQYKSYSLRFVITSKPKIYQKMGRWKEMGSIPAKIKGSDTEVHFHVFEKIKM
jgi:SAM-dependent methyltransferase